MESDKNESQKFFNTGAGILNTISSFCLGWSKNDLDEIFGDSEKGAEYYWDLFTKVRLTFSGKGEDMLAFIYELEDDEKTHLFKKLFNRDVKF